MAANLLIVAFAPDAVTLVILRMVYPMLFVASDVAVGARIGLLTIDMPLTALKPRDFAIG